MIERVFQLSLRSMGAAGVGVKPCVPGAKVANPHNEINQKALLFPALVFPVFIQEVWNPAQ